MSSTIPFSADDGVKIYVPAKNKGTAVSEPPETDEVKIYKFKNSLSSSSEAFPQQ